MQVFIQHVHIVAVAFPFHLCSLNHMRTLSLADHHICGLV